VKYLIIGLALLSLMSCSTDQTTSGWTLVIHGGAGGISRERIDEDAEAEYHAALEQALEMGAAVLRADGSAVDAVVAAVISLENYPGFNAGKGAVFTHEGKNELDASIMEGTQRNAGAVAGVTTVKNPIVAARAVMERSEHVMLSGAGADFFAAEQGLEIVEPEYFFTQRRWDDLQKLLSRENSAGVEADRGDYKFGTVGAVALDASGNLAAATSTGGMTNKRWGRVGDSPVIGAGTYASNDSCAVSATGHGEYFIRHTVARDICALMEFGNYTLDLAAREIIQGRLKEAGGSGGIIAVDAGGQLVMEFNSSGMFRGSISHSQPAYTAMFGDD